MQTDRLRKKCVLESTACNCSTVENFQKYSLLEENNFSYLWVGKCSKDMILYLAFFVYVTLDACAANGFSDSRTQNKSK